MQNVTCGVYSNQQIKEAINRGHIVCYPFNEKNINGSSVDVTLGEWFFRTEQPTGKNIYNPFDEHEVYRYFNGPHQATPHRQWCEAHGYQTLIGISDDHPIIAIGPGERILAHTNEFIGIKAPGTSSLQSRSTWGRNGISVCLDAGWGDPGYINRWTMEVYNMNQHHTVLLPVGERIAQMVFYFTGEVDLEYAKLSGKYQQAAADDLKKLIKTWRPEQMLPRAYRDSRQKPISI